jgi:hypothetical protein
MPGNNGGGYQAGKGRSKKKLEAFCIRAGEIDCVSCRRKYEKIFKGSEQPPCEKCLPELFEENRLVYEVYWRTGSEGIDPFRIMKMVGVRKEDRLYCLDLCQHARSEAMKVKQERRKNG